jgi:alkaline phosphatase D
MSTRRDWLRQMVLAAQAPALLRADRPGASWGSMAGDVTPGEATIWSRCDRPARMLVSWRTSPNGALQRVRGPVVTPETDFTGRVHLSGVPSGQTVLYEVQFEELTRGKAVSEPVAGRFRSAPSAKSQVSFTWSGDVAGQGWGINPEWGGMRGFEAVRQAQPDFFIHSGDTIYADGPIQAEVKLRDGSLWRNVVTEAKAKVAQTLADFRGNYLYNLSDANVRRFHSEVAQVWQWDDHEVLNNWSPGKDLRPDTRYQEKDIRNLVANGRQAFLEYSPIRFSNAATARIYRTIPYGPLVEVFVLDMRSYRGPNTYNRQEQEGTETAYLGKLQLDKLQGEVTRSKAVWKVIASDMPLGLMVGDGKDPEGREKFENSANGAGPALGRELELARLLGHWKQNKVKNIVWLTADTHYTSANHYHPDRAESKNFDPFWEFVSGPLHAGTFGPNPLDNTFGPQVVYQKAPPPGQANLPPSAGYQFFGEVKIDPKDFTMTVHLRDIAGNVLFTKELSATI